jgi:hypothetical protein
LLLSAGIASAQSTTTEPLSGYTNTTPTQTVAPTTTSKPDTETDTTTVAPTIAAQPAGSAPSSLAFTGGEPLLLIIAGLAIAGGTATLLVRDRRRSSKN